MRKIRYTLASGKLNLQGEHTGPKADKELVLGAVATFCARDLSPDEYERRGRLFAEISVAAQQQELMEEAERQMMIEWDDGGIMQAEDDSEADEEDEEEEEESSCDKDFVVSVQEEGTDDTEVTCADAADEEYQGSGEETVTEEGMHMQDNRTLHTTPAEKAGRGAERKEEEEEEEEEGGGRRESYNHHCLPCFLPFLLLFLLLLLLLILRLPS